MSATRRALGKVSGFLGKYVNREVLAERVQGTRKAFSEVSRGTVIEIIGLSLVVVIAAIVRLMPIRWGFYLNEFDPYLQYRMAQYVVDHGFLAWFSWHDTLSWYPYGADMPTWNLYGEAFVVAAISMFLKWAGTGISVFDVAVVFPVVAGTLTVLAAYLLGKDLWGKGVGMFTALFLALNASSISRTQLGFLRHEPLGILLMIMIFLFFKRATTPNSSTRRTIVYSTLAGLTLYYLAAAWAAFYYPLDLLVLYVVFLVVIGRSSSKLFLAYSICMGIFMLFTPFLVPKIGFSSLSDLTFLVVPACEVLLLAREASTYLPSGKVRVYTLALSVLATAAIILVLSYFNIISNPAGKFYAVINPLVRGDVPIIQSVAEHQPATWGSFFYEFGSLIFLGLLGFVFVVQRARNEDFFLLLWGLTGIYFAASFVRLTLLLAPAFCILAAIGTVELGKPAVDIIREAVIYPTRKTRVIARIGREFGVAIFLILLVLLVPTFWRTVQASYQPATIVTSSIPTAPTGTDDLKYSDWLQALSWMRENTAPTSVVFAWWDYGYWITALGQRRTLSDNGTQNSTQIAVVAQTFLDNSTMAIPNLRRYNVTYVAIFITPSGQGSSGQTQYQGFGEDGKWYWMARIGNNTLWNNYKIVYKEIRTQTGQTTTSTYYQYVEDPATGRVISNQTVADNNIPTANTMLGYMMQDATSQTTTPSPYFTQVFASSNKYVYLFKVNYATPTTLNVKAIKDRITYGQGVSFAGNLTANGQPLTGGPYTVALEYSTDSGQTWTPAQNYDVSSQGQFNFTWVPAVGVVLVRVHFLGTPGTYLDAAGQPTLLTVEKANATISLTASTTTASVGQDINLIWRMQPFLNSANVTLALTVDNKTFVPINTFLMTSSSMNYTWKVSVPGQFSLVVMWNGNDNFNQVTSAAVVINKT